MPSLKRFFELAPRYFQRFGTVRGADVLTRTIIAKLAPAGTVIRVRVPGLDAPLALRARSSDVKVFHQVFVDLEHDVKDLTGQATVIIDAGANVGFSSVLFATAFPGARVIAIEPEETNFAQLVSNAAAYPNITPVHAALWSHRDRVRISNPAAEQWAFRVDAAAGEGKDGMITALGVGDILADYDLEGVDILKIDIEGAETQVFGPGCESWIARVGFMMIELHDYLTPGCDSAVTAATERAGFGRSSRGEFAIFSRQRSGESFAAPTT
jgi:FkbM family methyltransferase